MHVIKPHRRMGRGGGQGGAGGGGGQGGHVPPAVRPETLISRAIST